MPRPSRANQGPGGRSRRPKIAGHNRSREVSIPTEQTGKAGAKRAGRRGAGIGGAQSASRADLGPANTKLLSAAIVMGTIAVAAAIVLAIVYGPSALRAQPQTDDLAFVDAAATTAVENRTKEALAAVFSYDYRSLDEDFNRALANLTENMQDEYRQTIDATRQAAEQRQATVEMVVQQAGVHALSSDEAELLALTLVSTQYDDAPGETFSGPLRVTLKKVDGEWLIDSIDER
ncbi:hypothetical protein ONR57_01295 [Hoyosella sp. YIM 151337]|uniref:hypothetical protein n=1 Tax=Hoyosella sp. YIM 151337 TaxID=2992742 RepID=UPI0022354350|nr:hypothetical protein [Hoyosella sp. YIM 151337]MCW4351934.1 hypothetical protein [Hoyosella sp. YIM 151337]